MTLRNILRMEEAHLPDREMWCVYIDGVLKFRAFEPTPELALAAFDKQCRWYNKPVARCHVIISKQQNTKPQ